MIFRWLVQKSATDRRGLAGAAMMAAFAILAGIRFWESHKVFFALLLFRDAMLSVLFLIRKPPRVSARIGPTLLAYASTALPLAYFSPSSGVSDWAAFSADILATLGFLIATLAAIDLGRRIGVAPAARGDLCKSGLYRYLRHPMYTGYAVAELGWPLLSSWNVPLFMVSLCGYLVRARFEDQILRSK